MSNGNGAPKPQFLVYRKVGTMTWSAFDQVQTLNIDRSNGIRSLEIRFNGQVDISGGSADGASLAESPHTFLKDVRLVGNGKDTIISESGEGLARWNYFEHGVLPTRAALSALDSVNSTLSGLLKLDLALPGGRVPIDTALISTLFSTLQLQITCGGKSELVNGTNDRTFAFDTFTADVYVWEIVNFRADLFGRIFAKRFFIESSDSNAATNFELPLPVGNAYRALMLETAAAAVPDTVATVLNNFKITAGSEIFFDAEDDAMQESFSLLKNVAVATGFYPLEFSPDGLIGEALDASGISTLKAIIDKNAVTSTRSRLHAIELVPIR